MPKLNFLFYLTILSVFIVSVINLNYNTPFNDEAIYIVIGRMGLFARDWWTYGASLWMAGLPYIYPTLTALAYQIGGIVGSRFLNVIFGVLAVEEIYRLTRQLHIFDPKTNQLAGIIAASILGFSAIGLYTSRLATYDMPSFFLLLFAINSFLKAREFAHGKYYFISSLALFLAFLTKIVAAIFYPPLLIFSWLIIRHRSPTHRSLYYKYFLAPLIIGLAFYVIFFSSSLFTFTSTHIDNGTSGTYRDILRIIWDDTFLVLILTAITFPVLLFTKKVIPALSLLALAAIIPVFHLLLNRVPTLDKHLYLTVSFLAVIIGIGLARLINFLPKHPLSLLPVILLISAFAYISQPNLYQLEHSWPNTSNLQTFLASKVKLDDRLLTQDGASMILALYDKLYPPTHITTFDWIDYSGIQTNEGYYQAIKDQYFDYIQIDDDTDSSAELKSQILFRLTAKYSLIYQQDGFSVYAKVI